MRSRECHRRISENILFCPDRVCTWYLGQWLITLSITILDGDLRYERPNYNPPAYMWIDKKRCHLPILQCGCIHCLNTSLPAFADHALKPTKFNKLRIHLQRGPRGNDVYASLHKRLSIQAIGEKKESKNIKWQFNLHEYTDFMSIQVRIGGLATWFCPWIALKSCDNGFLEMRQFRPMSFWTDQAHT